MPNISYNEIGQTPTTRSVFKVIIGDDKKYYIAKASSIKWFIDEIGMQYGRALRPHLRKEGTDTKKGLYYPIIRELLKMGDKPVMTLEYIFESENGYQVLKKELELLAEHFGKKGCINENNVPHVPKTTHQTTASKSAWLTQSEMMNFHKLLNGYEY